MAQIKGLEINNESPLQLPTLAFESEKALPYSLASELVEGLLIAKDGMSRKKFLKQYCQGSIENDFSYTLSILIGTKDAIHKWLRMSGYGRCALWIEYNTLEGGHEIVYSNLKLELVYRQRDYKVFHVQVLKGCKLALLRANRLNFKQSKTKNICEDDCEYDWNGLQQQESDQMDGRYESKCMDSWKTTTMQWCILIKVPTFKKLKNMLSPGGALWEFRRLLAQVISLPEFLDIDFQNINLQERLTHHPYAVFLVGHDAILTRSTSKGLFIWKIIRFDFHQGVVTLASGETLKGLLYCIKRHVYQKSLIENITHHKQKTKNKRLHKNLFDYEYSKYSYLDWAVWRGVYQAGPLETILTSAFANEDDCMVLKSLARFFLVWKNKDICQCCMAYDLGTAFRECRNTLAQSCIWKPSSKECRAVSHLRSIKQEVRRQGVCTLLDILFYEVKDFNSCSLQKTTLNNARTPTRSTISSPMSSRSSNNDANNISLHLQEFKDFKKEVYLEEKENVSLLSGLIAVMDRPLKKNELKKEKIMIGNETQRAFQNAEIKWKYFEDMKSHRSYSIGKKTYRKMQFPLRWQQVLEWIDNGFLDILLNEGISNVLENGKNYSILVEDIANACLQVVKMLPSEGSNRIVNCLISKLRHFIDVFTTLQITNLQQVGLKHELLIQQKIDKFKISFKEMVQFCKLLSLLLKSSVAITSSFARLDGLFLTFNLYSIIAKKFPIDVNNLKALNDDILIEALPGEVLRFEKYSFKELSPYSSINNNMPSLQRFEKIKPKPKLPLQEVLVPPQLPCAFIAINLKVSKVTRNDEFQSTTQNLLDTSKSNAPMTIHKDTTNESHMSISQTLKNLIDIAWQIKIHLLQSLTNMFGSQSIILTQCKAKMRFKLFIEGASLDILSLFLLDLIGGHSNALSPYLCNKLNELIFKIIYLIEKDEEDNGLYVKNTQKNQPNFQYVEDGPWWSGPGPPIRRNPQIQLLGLMLVELKEKMDLTLASLMVTIPGHVLKDAKNLEDYKKMTKEHAEKYIYTLWINLAYLFLVLSDYISYWPTKESKSQYVLRCCGGHFHQTLSILANLGPTASWAPAQLLTMQSLLKLLSLCIEDSIIIDAKENWSDYKNFLWKMLIDTWAHWNCIQSYINWMTLEVCHFCLINQINDFQKSLIEPIYLHYLALEEKLGMRRNCEDLFENFQYTKFMHIEAMMFLRLVVHLAQQKFYTCNNSHQDGSAYLCFRNNALWFLHEIMNPLHGLLITTIKNKSLRPCTNCKIETINPNFLSEIFLQNEKYSLILLTHIFNFKIFPFNTYVQENYSQICTNVYLSKKYLIHFLHVLYSNFKDLYIGLIQQIGLNSLCTLQEIHLGKDENKWSSSNQSSLKNTSCNDNIIHSTVDETLNLCYLHVQVLHVIAKNFTKEGNQIFKDLCIMDFLVQEISLEHEFSQIVEVKLDSKFEMPTISTSSNLQGLSSNNNSNIPKEDSHSSSNSIRSCCMFSSSIKEYEFNYSILSSHNHIQQRGSKKYNTNDNNPIVSLEQRKLDFDKMNYATNYCCKSERKISIASQDENSNDNKNIVRNVPIPLTCDTKFRNINFGSTDDENDAKKMNSIEYKKSKMVYSGRFFDLNEEVEHELASEDKYELNEKNDRESFSLESTTPTSFRNIEKIIPSTLNGRPWIPKLNFTTTLQKAQFNIATDSNSEIIYNEYEKQYFINEDNNIECKSSNLTLSYEKERSKRCIYYNSSLHILLLELIISLMLDPQGALEVYYCDRFPMEHRKINAPFYLFYHINHVSNEYIVPILAKNLAAFHPSAYRILKLTWQAIFDPSLYSNRVRIAQGALSQVEVGPILNKETKWLITLR